MDEMRLAKTCSTCIHSRFGSKASFRSYYRGAGKKQLGVCMVLCNGEEPPFSSDLNLYDYVAKEGVMMPIQEYVNSRLIVTHARLTNLESNLLWQLAYSGQTYEPRFYYYFSDTGINYTSYEKEGYERITLEEYKRNQDIQNLRLLAQCRNDFFSDMVGALDTAVKTWHKFKTNFDWWQANKMKMRRCHRNTTCDLHKENKRRETVARSIANGGYELEWKKN